MTPDGTKVTDSLAATPRLQKWPVRGTPPHFTVARRLLIGQQIAVYTFH